MNFKPFLEKPPETKIISINPLDPKLEFKVEISKPLDPEDKLSTMKIISKLGNLEYDMR